MGDEALDIDQLVTELEQEARELRGRIGPSSVSELKEPGIAPGSTDARAPSSPGTERLDTALRRMRELTDPRAAPLTSHRPRVGAAILALKRLLIRLLTPVWNQQTAFNRELHDALDELRAALRESDARIDRRLLAVEDVLARLPDSPGWGELGIDYQAFEERFRGDAERIVAGQQRYLDYFPDASAGPVIDLGCGRGEFLGLLRERGIRAWGVDRDRDCVARARSSGLDVRQGDLVDALEACDEASLGGVVTFQVIEHLSLPIVLRVISLARRKLRPGGCLLAETVNLQSLIVHTRGWTLDPTHRQPFHPLTLRFLIDSIGFTRSALVYSGEVDREDLLEDPTGDDLGLRNVSRLNALLFGPQDYAVVAWA